MFAVAVLRACFGATAWALSSYAAFVPYLDHVMLRGGQFLVALSAYGLVMHAEGHAMDAAVRALGARRGMAQASSAENRPRSPLGSTAGGMTIRPRSCAD